MGKKDVRVFRGIKVKRLKICLLALMLVLSMMPVNIFAGETGVTGLETAEKTSTSMDKNDDKATPARDGYTVEYLGSDGTVEEEGDDGTFERTSLDKGKFVVKRDGTVLSDAFFSASVKMSGGGSSWTNVWVLWDGSFQGHDVRTVDVKVYEDEMSAMLGDEPITVFKINNKKSAVESVHAFVGGEEVSVDNPAELTGNESGTAVFKGKVNGELVDIPYSALTIKAVDSYEGTIQNTNGVFGINTKNNNTSCRYKAVMKDGSGSVEFKAVIAKSVELESFKVTYPETFKISKWNGLSDEYIGLIRSSEDKASDCEFAVEVTPGNAENQELEWVSHDPEIAEYFSTWGEIIVPQKAGTAHFTVSSKEKPELKQEITIKFEYENPLQRAEVKEPVLKLEKGDYREFEIDCGNATEQRFEWEFEKIKGDDSYIPGLSVSSSIGQSDDDDEVFLTSHWISANVNGIYKVTGIPYDDTGKVSQVSFTVIVGDVDIDPEPPVPAPDPNPEKPEPPVPAPDPNPEKPEPPVPAPDPNPEKPEPPVPAPDPDPEKPNKPVTPPGGDTEVPGSQGENTGGIVQGTDIQGSGKQNAEKLPAQNSQVGAVQTGDSSDMNLPVLLIPVCGLGIMTIRRKKNS